MSQTPPPTSSPAATGASTAPSSTPTTTTPPVEGSSTSAAPPTTEPASSGTVTEKQTLNAGLFDDQAFLIYNITKLAPIHKQVHVEKGQTYKKLDLLKGPNVAVINRLLNSDFNKKQPILTLTPAQISELVPQIRVFKQYLKQDLGVLREIEFNFDAYLGATSVLESRDLGRAGYGFKSLEIESQGTTEFESDKMFNGKLQLFFQDLDQLVKSRGSGEGQYSFLDLLIHPPVGGTPQPVGAEGGPQAVSSLPARTDASSAFRIRIEVGWSAGQFNSISAYAGDSKNVLEAIRQTKMSFVMNPTIHNLNINDDGTVTLDIDFIGSFDRVNRELRAGMILTKEQRKKLQDKSDELKRAADAGDQTAIKKVREEFTGLQTILTKEGFESIVRDLMEPADKVSRVYQTIVSREAMNQFGTIGAPKTESSSTPPADGTSSPPAPTSSNAPAPASTTQSATNSVGTPTPATSAGATTPPDPNAVTPTDPNAAPAVVLPVASPIDFCQIKWTQQTFEDQGYTYYVFDPIQEAEGTATLDSFKNTPIVKDSFGREYHNLSWIYLGDLLEVVMKRAYDPDAENDAATLRSFGKSFSSRVKLILSDIEIFDYCDGKPKRLNLAHVPISLKKFTTFFYNKVISTRNLDYTVDDFIKALINDLLEEVFLRRNYLANGSYKQDVKVKYMNLAVFSKTLGVDPLNPDGDVVRTNALSAGNMIKASGPDINPKNYFFYMVLYQDIFNPNEMRGSYNDDLIRGIPHIYMGRDLGILKKTTFTKNQVPYQREERIRKLGTSFDPALVLMSLYDISLQMYGNTLFLPGKYLYLVPTGMGPTLGLPNDPKSYSNLMGLGGYYLVTKVIWSLESGVYATNLNGKHEYTGGGKLANKQLYARDAGIGITD